ncbi:M23 family metallopeptidase [Oceanobacillus sp. J11TS1]|uniref:M23 family metallopeptidase n=1 Tax=Oceanobacillus sp. J11TS1 TaxID=2807191 RepID=UPI001B0C423F|nr:M23 family metallopeptidase [Oceanobacillus sp. J11TS1]GIO21792.1 hypothetical protein J11TS1_03730 [Oceanobacillus sp. J11TS1]
MDKNVKKIRKSIEMRQKAKGLNKAKPNKEDYLQSNVLPDMEESHGFYPSISTGHTNSATPKNHSRITNIAVKAMLSVSLFLGTAFVTEVDKPFMDQPKEWVTTSLTNQFPFAKVNAWYSEAFGNPLSFRPSTVTTEEVTSDTAYLPVNGTIEEHFHENGQGIYIEAEGGENVAAIQEGIVVFAGNDRNTDKTVKIQHADGSTSQYGFLDSIDVHLYQYISNGQVLGTLESGGNHQSVFFAIEHENQYIDPEQVILVDQQP